MFEVPDDDFLWEDFPLDAADVDQAFNSVHKEAHHSSTVSASKQQGTSYPYLNSSKVSSDINESTEAVSHSEPCVENATPTSVREGLRSKCKRKFPGPAGLLPPTTPTSLAQAGDTPGIKSLPSHCTPDWKDEICSLPLSQAPSDDVFTSPSWKILLSDLGLDAQTVLNKFSIKNMLFKASRRLLHRGKIPLIVGVMESLDMQGADASFVIRDPSGKMNGSLHRDLIKDPASALQIGCVLVLRQVSVISPSNRTHYLNVTPGNVVLIYSNNKDAEVSKRSWVSFQSPPTETNSCMKDFVEIPSLKQIIEESEQELSASLRNFRQRLARGSSPSIDASPLSSRIGQSHRFSSPFRFTPGVAGSSLTSPVSLSGSSFTSTPRGNPALLRPRHSITPSGQGYSSATHSGTPLFSTGLRSPSPFPQGQSGCGSESPLQPTNGTQNFRQPFPVPGANQTVAVSVSNFGISGARAVRNCPTATANIMSYKNLPVGSKTHNPPNISPVSNSLQPCRLLEEPERATGYIEASASNSTTDKKNNSLNSFDFDGAFPEDDDDHIIAQLCDEEWSPPTDSICDGIDYVKNICDSSSTTNEVNVIDYINTTPHSDMTKQFVKLRQGNLEMNLGSDIPDSFKDKPAFHKTKMCVSDLQASPGSQVNTGSGAVLISTDSSCRTVGSKQTFSFKRMQPKSNSPSLVTPAKRPMCEAENLSRISSGDKGISTPNPRLASSASLENNENVNVLSKRPLRISSVVSPSENSSSRVQMKGVGDSVIYSENETGGSRSLANSSRDSRIQLGRGDSGVPRGDKDKPLQKNSLPQWDTDLNDDLLLSQLCEEF